MTLVSVEDIEDFIKSSPSEIAIEQQLDDMVHQTADEIAAEACNSADWLNFLTSIGGWGPSQILTHLKECLNETTHI